MAMFQPYEGEYRHHMSRVEAPAGVQAAYRSLSAIREQPLCNPYPFDLFKTTSLYT